MTGSKSGWVSFYQSKGGFLSNDFIDRCIMGLAKGKSFHVRQLLCLVSGAHLAATAIFLFQCNIFESNVYRYFVMNSKFWSEAKENSKQKWIKWKMIISIGGWNNNRLNKRLFVVRASFYSENQVCGKDMKKMNSRSRHCSIAIDTDKLLIYLGVSGDKLYQLYTP